MMMILVLKQRSGSSRRLGIVISARQSSSRGETRLKDSPHYAVPILCIAHPMYTQTASPEKLCDGMVMTQMCWAMGHTIHGLTLLTHQKCSILCPLTLVQNPYQQHATSP